VKGSTFIGELLAAHRQVIFEGIADAINNLKSARKHYCTTQKAPRFRDLSHRKKHIRGENLSPADMLNF